MGIVEATYAELKQQELQKNPYSCLHMADIDINPHQVEAFTFALSSLESGGAIFADEVGLGKTIEAGLVIKYLLQSGIDKILLIMPSNLRKQWQVELEEKFDITSLIVDSANWDDYLIEIKKKQSVIIVSYHFASKRKEYLGKVAWDICVFDEAHRLRNVHKSGSKMANSLYELTKGIPKILLTATPMQNTLLDMYGLVQYIDERIFYSKAVFSERYMRNENYSALKDSLSTVIQRTLRKEVAEYIQFSERKEMTIDFELSPLEIELYVMINNYLKKEVLYALPNSHRTLITSVIRKLLASSSMAVAETFKVLKGRLEVLKETTRKETADESIDFFLSFFDDDEIETDEESKQDELYTREKVNEFIQHEIDEVEAIIYKAESISKNAKMTALKQAVEKAFTFQSEAGIAQKIVIFTESIRTQQYIFDELSAVGYEGQILKFNGNANDNITKQIYKAWKAKNYGKYLGSRNVEMKNAIVEAFRDEYKILLVTDSGSEGLNLQFCNTIINYDLPWNPQKIEQRIGRCHRYGQKNDVVVINLLNTQNVADKRVYEILSEKFELFQGVFGASDKAIGLLESGADFEKRVTQIYQECKTSSDFAKEFKALEKELDKKRNKKMEELKNLFIYKTEEQHKQGFHQILQEIAQYDSQCEYWKNKSIEHGKVNYPLYYETDSVLDIPGIKHGYLLLGVSSVDADMEEVVFEIIDSRGKMYGVSDLLARDLCKKLQDNELQDKSPDNQKILAYIDMVTKYIQQSHIASKQELIQKNKDETCGVEYSSPLIVLITAGNFVDAIKKTEYGNKILSFALPGRSYESLQDVSEIVAIESDFIELFEDINKRQKVLTRWFEGFYGKEYYGKLVYEGIRFDTFSIKNESCNMIRVFKDKYKYLADKIKAMLTIDNGEYMKESDWPSDLMYYEGEIVGYLVNKATAIPENRTCSLYEFMRNNDSLKDKLNVAIQICEFVEKLHRKNVVIGIFEPGEILVDEKLKVFWEDAWRWHVLTAEKEYGCETYHGEYIAKEVFEK